MKKISIFLVAVLCFLAIASLPVLAAEVAVNTSSTNEAEASVDEGEENKPLFYVSFTGKSRYIDPAGFLIYDKPAFVTTMGVEWEGWYFELYHLAGTADHQFDELDWCFGYNWDSSLPGTEKKLNWEAGFSLYDPRDYFSNEEGENFYDFYVKVGIPLLPEDSKQSLSPYVKLEFLTPVDKGDWGGGGTYIWLGVEHSIEFEKCSFVQDLAALFDSGVYDADSGQVVKYLGQLDWPVTEKCTISLPAVEVSLPLSSFSEENDGRNSEISVEIKIAHAF